MRNRTVIAMALIAVCALADTGPAAAAAPNASRSETPDSLRVWAYFDGDTPVDGGQVRVYSGERLLQEGDAASDRTFPEGTALLRFSSLPRDLRVVVTGGRAGGRQLVGSLTAEVHGATDGTLVEVNPVTTLADAWTDAGRRRTPGRARNVIERLLGIPRILDDADLYATDRWFDGDTFERYALAHGSVEAAVNALVRYVDRPGDQRRVFRARRRSRKRASSAASPIKVSISSGADAVLGELLDLIASAGPSTGPQGVVFGLVMKGIQKAISLKFGAAKEVDEVKASLAGIAARLAELQAQLGEAVFQLQVEATRQDLTDIEAAQRDVDWALRDPASTEEGRAAFLAATKAFLNVSGPKLAGLGLRLHTALARHQATRAPGGAPALLPGVRRTIGAERFFTHASSLRIREFFAFYEVNETRLAELLSEYHVLRDELATATERVREIKSDFLPPQRRALPPRNLDRLVFIDTTSKLMWGVEPAPRSAAQIVGSGFSECSPSVLGARTCVLRSNAQFAGFSDWQMPTAKQATGLFAGLGDDDPIDWLKRVGVHFDPTRIPGKFRPQQDVALWVRDTFKRYGGSTGSIHAELLVLKPGPGYEKTLTPPTLHSQQIANGCVFGPVANPPKCSGPQATAGGFILWVRPTTSEERAQYW
jgi:hypothetical protein